MPRPYNLNAERDKARDAIRHRDATNQERAIHDLEALLMRAFWDSGAWAAMPFEDWANQLPLKPDEVGR